MANSGFRRFRLVSVGCIGAAILVQHSTPARAEHFAAADVVTDARLYFTAPLRWDGSDWLHAAEVAAAVVAAHEADNSVHRHFAPAGTSLGIQDKNSTKDALPAAAIVLVTWGFSVLTDDPAGHIEAYTMLEAAAFSAVTTEVTKYVAGRRRPTETDRVDDWRHGGNAFPSMHATAAFAIGTVLAESGNDDYRWFRRTLGYGIAAYTGYKRLHDNQHWLSDTVAGAAIGISTARFTLNRREARASDLEVSVGPTGDGGVSLRFSKWLN